MNLEKEKNFISAIVYVHNNESELDSFIDRLYKQLEDNFIKFEIICVNDSSTDNSVNVIKDKAENLSKGIISIINMSFYQGLELSMNAGVDLSIGDFVFEFDSIASETPVEKLMEVYFKSLKGYDIVSISPKEAAGIDSKLFYNIFNAYSNKNYAINTESYHVISRRAINRCQSLSKTIPYRKAVYADCGLKITNIKADFKMNSAESDRNKRIDTAVDALILFTNAATKMNLYIMGLFMLACIAVVAYVVYIYISGHPVSGWTTIMLFMSFGFLGIFVILAITMKYLSVIIDLIFKNKTYITESIEKLSK